MEPDEEAPHAACQITSRNEPSLGKAYRVLHDDSVQADPFYVEKKGKGLLYVGPQQIEDEDDELICASGFGVPLEKSPCKQDQQREGSNEG